MKISIYFNGKIPYKDIIDMNPPFSSWIFMLPVAFCHYLRLSSLTLITICKLQIYVFLIAVIVMVYHFIKNPAFLLSKSRIIFFIAMFTGIITLGCARTLGQRDQLILAFLTPALLSACLAALPGSGIQIRPGLRVAAGMLAFAAIAMKPHYIIPLLLAEGVILLRQSRLNRCFRMENWVILGLGLLYTLIIIIFYPGIFTLTGNTAIRFYNGMSVMSVKKETLAVLPVFGLLLMRLFYSGTRNHKIFDPLLAASCGAYLAYLSQGIGYTYQEMPFEGLAGMWLCLATPSLWPFVKPDAPFSAYFADILHRYQIRTLLVSVFILAAAIVTFQATLQTGIGRALQMTGLLMGLQENDDAIIMEKTLALLHRYAPNRQPVLFLTTSMDMFPALAYDNNEITSRWGFLWPLPAELKLPPEQRGYIARALAEDIARYKPVLVLVRTEQNQVALPYGFDTLHYLNEWPEFAREWAHYQLILPNPAVESGLFALYRRVDPAPP